MKVSTCFVEPLETAPGHLVQAAETETRIEVSHDEWIELQRR
jgi:hypothetical protein